MIYIIYSKTAKLADFDESNWLITLLDVCHQDCLGARVGARNSAYVQDVTRVDLNIVV